MKAENNFEKYRGALKHLAFDSKASRGRRNDKDEEINLYGNIFDPFQLDIEKIRLGKFYRRLYGKTQVFPPDKHANIRNRQIHTLEVVSVAGFLASFLGLNKYLAEAIAYGHDIGHTPFGHLGERAISEICAIKFKHATMGIVVAQKLERGGKGLNLCYETLEGMLNHSRGGKEMVFSNGISSEASLVMISDKIAYTYSDLNDAFKVGYFSKIKFPEKLASYFGTSQRERIAKTCLGLIKESAEKGEMSFSTSDEAKNFIELRNWMYENLYHKLDVEEERLEKKEHLFKIWEHINQNSYFSDKGVSADLAISIMTDNEALNFFKTNSHEKERVGYLEIINNLKKKNIELNIFQHDLNVKDFKYHCSF